MTIEKLARQTLGYEQLRPGQREAVEALEAGRDTLAILPTGAGKSAIYQLAGMQLPGPVIVVSPLLALQKDQIEAIEAHDLAKAAALNSRVTETEREEIFRELGAGELKFLFLAPEQLANPEVVERLSAVKPSLFVVDEAHCVSQWGHDFRPDYMRLHTAIETLGRPAVLALTATAAPPVRDEIIERLDLQNPKIVLTGFDRPNLFLEVRRFEDEASKRTALIQAVIESPKPAIVYAATRVATEELAAELSDAGICVCAYHAGLPKAERDERQNDFMSGGCEVIVATIAFGLGVDKPDVRRVWHHSVSDSLDSYYQEAGRAGRDGEEAQAVLFYLPGDLGLRRYQAATGRSTPKVAAHVASVVAELAGDGSVSLDDVKSETGMNARQLTKTLTYLEDAGAVEIDSEGDIVPNTDVTVSQIAHEVAETREKQKQWEKSRLEMMRQYVEETGCRRQFLLGYFGETRAEPCGHCDNCRDGLTKATVATSTEEPFPVGVRVTHRAWGDGHVLRYDGDKIVVVFDAEGYKTLVVNLVVENQLLVACA